MNLNYQVSDEISRLLHYRKEETMTPIWTVICSEPNLVLKPVRVTRGEHILPLLMGKDMMLSSLLLHSRPDPAWGSARKAPPAIWERLQQGERS